MTVDIVEHKTLKLSDKWKTRNRDIYKYKRKKRTKSEINVLINASLDKLSTHVDREQLETLLVLVGYKLDSAAKLSFLSTLEHYPIDVLNWSMKLFFEVYFQLDLERSTPKTFFLSVLSSTNKGYKHKYVSSSNIFRLNGDSLRSEVYNLIKGLLK